MKAETPEWKKEIAEKVKAYGERKKRLTTPPGPIKENSDSDPDLGQIELSSVPVFVKPAEPRIEKFETPAPQPPQREPAPKIQPRTEPAPQAPLEVWTEDVDGVEISGAEETVTGPEPMVSAGPYTLRRIAAGLIDHTILIVLWIVFVAGFWMITRESLDNLFTSGWSVTLPIFLLFHFIYYLYFFRATRQTPGMLFLSLELRDPGSSVIPIGKVLARWISMVLLNLFNFLPLFAGKRFLLMDLLSATEMRSFK